MLLKTVRYAVANAPYDFTNYKLRITNYELRTILYPNLSCMGNIPEIYIT